MIITKDLLPFAAVKYEFQIVYVRPDPIEAIKFRMEPLEVKPSDLAKILGGAEPRVGSFNKRKLTVEMMRSFAKAFSHSRRIVIGLSSDGVSAVNHYLVSQGCSTVKS